MKNYQPLCAPELGAILIRKDIWGDKADVLKNNLASLICRPISHHLLEDGVCWTPSESGHRSGRLRATKVFKREKAKVVWDSHLPLDNSSSWKARLTECKKTAKSRSWSGEHENNDPLKTVGFAGKTGNGGVIADSHDLQGYCVIKNFFWLWSINAVIFCGCCLLIF